MARDDGWCVRIHLREDNARFLLLAVFMVSYMCLGATIFMLLERDKELEDKAYYSALYENFTATYPNVSESELKLLLSVHADASAAGLLGQRDRWDFSGSFYFVGTVVSTIGKVTCASCKHYMYTCTYNTVPYDIVI